MTDNPQDADVRIEHERHAGFVIRNKQLLVMHRIKNGQEYYVIPGGHRRRGETGEETVIREVREETGIMIKNPKLVFEFDNHLSNGVHYYYLCEWVSGEKPQVLGEEKDADPSVNFYEPVWVDLKKAEKLDILPQYAKEWLMKYLADFVTSR